MATVNIRRDVKDSYYRYKMPVLLSKVEGKGNGIKTVIPNMSSIATSLARPASYPTKFFGIELGAQSKSDKKTDKYIVNGAHDAKKLQELLDVFIKKFVLCPSCHNPETDLVVNKAEQIIMICQACGARNSADNRHKLVAYILKYPPPKKTKSSEKYKNGGSTTPPDETGKSRSGSPDADDAGSDDELTSRIAAEAAHLPTADQVQITDDDWSVDTSAEAVAARMKELTVNQSLLGEDFDDDDDGGGENKYEIFGKWLEEQGGPVITASDADIVAKAEELGVGGKHKAVQVLVQCLFDEGVVGQVGKRARLLAKFGRSEKHQKSILGALERLIGLSHPALLKKVPIILKVFYDADLIEEEVIIKWGEKASKKYVDRKTSEKVKEAAKPFIDWLENAEIEESEEEDD